MAGFLPIIFDPPGTLPRILPKEQTSFQIFPDVFGHRTRLLSEWQEFRAPKTIATAQSPQVRPALPQQLWSACGVIPRQLPGLDEIAPLASLCGSVESLPIEFIWLEVIRRGDAKVVVGGCSFLRL
jgi:hypothetical protein